MPRRVLPFLLCALLATACGGEGGDPSTPPAHHGAGADPARVGSFPRCDAVPDAVAPPHAYRESPIYVANEQPTDQIRAWAENRPGYQEIWIDREHLGWVTVAFTEDVEVRQAELEERFPGVGVVAVSVPRRRVELEALQQRVNEQVGPLFPISSWVSVSQGVVGVGLGVLRPERVAAIEARFAGQPLCLEGTDPADAPAAGPQRPAGDGWRLLADEPGAGEPYRTGIATDARSYTDLWADIGLAGDPPAVDFEHEVVIWFGAVYGSSCPDLRLDDVVVDRQRALVHAEIVLVNAPMACTADANPRAYLVALERARLPRGPFAIQLAGDDPPDGAPEERTIVEVDLSPPGTVAGPGDVHADDRQPEPDVLESGSYLEPGFPFRYRFDVRCGIEWLGRVNDVDWRTNVPAGAESFVPQQWQQQVAQDGILIVSVVMTTEPSPMIEATANGLSVVYRPNHDAAPSCG